MDEFTGRGSSATRSVMIAVVQNAGSVEWGSSPNGLGVVGRRALELESRTTETMLSPLIRSVAMGLLPAVLLFGCQRSSSRERNSSAAASAERRTEQLRELTATYRSRGLAERMKAAADGCYVGDSCQRVHHEALLAGADDDSEREALRATARPVFARQYQDALRQKRQQVERVRAVGPGRLTLRVEGPLCSRFFLENFTGRPEGSVARALGFSRVECESRAVRAGLDLGSVK